MTITIADFMKAVEAEHNATKIKCAPTSREVIGAVARLNDASALLAQVSLGRIYGFTSTIDVVATRRCATEIALWAFAIMEAFEIAE